MTNTSLGEKLRYLREKKGITQTDVASFLFVTRQTVSNWERNVSIPDVSMLQSLATLYGVTTEYLVVNSFSKLRDLVVRNTVLLIILATILSTLVIGTIYVTNSKEYRNAIVNFEGICSAEKEYIVLSSGDEFELLIVDYVDLDLEGRAYCVPVSFRFSYRDKTSESYEIRDVSTPTEFGVEVSHASVVYNLNYDSWVLDYGIRVGVHTDTGSHIFERIRKVLILDEAIMIGGRLNV